MKNSESSKKSHPSEKKKPPPPPEPEENPSTEKGEAAEAGPGEETALLAKALEEKTKEAASHYEQLLRARAEFENFKKRQAREHSQFLKYANENLIHSLLPIINNLERANEAAKANQDIAALRVGVEMILKMFFDALKQAGVEPIESAGRPFDPAKHEVISCVESPDHEENTVLQEFEKGYTLHDRLLCPAKVSVSKKPQEQ